MREAWIIDAVRTPTGRKQGTLRHVRADELAATVLRALRERTGIPAGAVEDVVLGCVTPVGENGWNIGRTAALAAGYPVETCGLQLNRMCGSGLQAVNQAAQAIMAGAQDLVIAGGAENMSRVPMGSDGGDIHPAVLAGYEIVSQHEAAERVARRWGLSRPQLDEYSFHSHQKAAAAWREGRFAPEVVPVTAVTPAGAVRLDRDETVRPDTTVERIGSLPPLFPPDGVIHAGNSSQISDGAAALLLAAPEKARELGLRPRARIVSMATVGVDPTLMLHGVIPATAKALRRAGLQVQDVDLFEVNEAFAPVPLAWLAETEADPKRLNVNGGAIALGHPLGASGARLLTTALYELERRGGRFALITLCIGFGMAVATVMERLAGEV